MARGREKERERRGVGGGSGGGGGGGDGANVFGAVLGLFALLLVFVKGHSTKRRDGGWTARTVVVSD